MSQGKLRDPADKLAEKKAEQQAVETARSFDVARLKGADLKPVPITAARGRHPFDGYPMQSVKIGTYRDAKGNELDLITKRSFLVVLNPKIHVFQDPSNAGTGLKTYHNRTVRDLDRGTSVNTSVHFDRTIELDDGTVIERCAIVPSHSARAQLMFRLDPKTAKVSPDDRYLLFDIEQVSRLRQLFEMINNPAMKAERLARAISGESEEALEEIPLTEAEQHG